MNAAPRLALLLSLCLLLPACPDEATRRPLRIFAAASLTEAFTDLEAVYEAAHPEVDAQLVFAGSQTLRLQIEHGAQADLFASAHPGHAAALEKAGLMQPARPFAANALVIATAPGNPLGIRGISDLPRAPRIVWGVEAVPVGRYARQALDAAEAQRPGLKAAVEAQIVSEASNTRLVRAQLQLGEADAALIYRTDVSGADLQAVPIPGGPEATYVIGALGAPRPEAQAWLDLLRGPEGQRILQGQGFTPR